MRFPVLIRLVEEGIYRASLPDVSHMEAVGANPKEAMEKLKRHLLEYVKSQSHQHLPVPTPQVEVEYIEIDEDKMLGRTPESTVIWKKWIIVVVSVILLLLFMRFLADHYIPNEIFRDNYFIRVVKEFLGK